MTDSTELDDQLRALDDLDAEFEAGELERDDYETLRDEYTLRVADTMRQLGHAGDPSGSPASAAVPTRGRRVGLIALVAALVFAVGAGWLLARSAGERGVGDALTGQIESNRQRVFECQEMGTTGQLIESLQCFDEVLIDDPDNVEALAYRGWFVVLASSSAESAGQDGDATELLEVGRTYLDRAVEVDPGYADARAFRSVVYDRLGFPDEACAELAALIELDPAPIMLNLTQGVADRSGC